jgi:hypothetical protein
MPENERSGCPVHAFDVHVLDEKPIDVDGETAASATT